MQLIWHEEDQLYECVCGGYAFWVLKHNKIQCTNCGIKFNVQTDNNSIGDQNEIIYK